uniref:T9SS type A sorting domain-containing protein n=1 Tax=uncultured Draconibacterium sp. TaxID=1573823 RepID=UPI003216C8E1
DEDGVVSVAPSGGTPGYSYEWTDAADAVVGSTASVSGLGVGIYTVVVTDANGCEATCDAEVTEPPLLEVLCTGDALDCFGDEDGVVSVAPSGGTPGYSYEWTDAADAVVGSTASVSGLGVGIYTVVVTDANGCEATCDAEVTEPPLLTCSTVGHNSGCDSPDGWAELTVQGGTPPYFVSVDGGAFVAITTLPYNAGGFYEIMNLTGGITHTVDVIDANGCTSECDVFIGADPCPCETAFGYGEDQDITGVNIMSRSFLDDCTPAGPWSNWGWTNYIPSSAEGNTFYFPMYAGAPVCDPSPEYNNHIVGTAVVEYYSGEVSITFTDLKPGYTFDGFHIWTGDTPFPPKNAPGQWTAGTNFDFDGGWIVIHAVYCGPQLPLPTVQTAKSAAISEPMLQASELKVYPNPFSEKVTFEFVSDVDAYGVLELYNITGQRVARIMDRYVQRGVLNTVEYIPEHKVTGMYLYRLDLDGKVQIGRIIYNE